MARRRYQRGSVLLRGINPIWVGRYREDVIGADGTKRRIRRTVFLGTKRELPTKRMAERKMEAIVAHINVPGYRAGRAATLEEFAEKWKIEVLSKRKPSTIHAANSHLRNQILPALGKLRLDEIDIETQQSFVSRISGTVSRKMLLNVLGTLSSMLRTAKNWGYICEELNLSRLALPEREVCPPARFFTSEQAKAILAASSGQYRAMFAIAAMTGLRAGEILGLQIGDLDFAGRVLHVRRSVWRGRVQTTKSMSSEAALPIPGALEAILRAYLSGWKPNPDGWLFLNLRGHLFIAENVVRQALWPILDELKIPRCGFHKDSSSWAEENVGPPDPVQRNRVSKGIASGSACEPG